MTQIMTNTQFDFRSFNVYAFLNGLTNRQFFDNYNVSLDSSDIAGLSGTYNAPDLYAVWSGSTALTSARDSITLSGNFTLSPTTGFTGGTLTGFTLSGNGPTNPTYVAILGFSYSALAFQKVLSSSTNTDDIGMLKNMIAGADRINGSAYSDYAFGWTGNDKLFGNNGNDTLSGDDGNDYVRGGNGDDSLKGGNGADTLIGDAGNDRIYDGLGTDVVTGGAGSDFFYFTFGSINNDRVTDFADGADRLFFDVAAGSTLTVANVLADAVNITGGVRFTLDDGDVLTIMGVTKAQLADQVFLY